MLKYKKLFILFFLMVIIITPSIVKADTEDEIKAELNEVMNEKYPNDTITLNSIKPSLIDDEAYIMYWGYLNNELYSESYINNSNYLIEIGINENETNGVITITSKKDNNVKVTKNVNLQWKQVDQVTFEKINNAVSSAKKTIDDEGVNYLFDIKSINYNLLGDKNWLTTLYDFIDISNLLYGSIPLRGMGMDDTDNPLFAGVIGDTAILHDGIFYNYIKQMFVIYNIIYIPSNTQETKEAYIKAAQDKINTYYSGLTLSQNNLIYNDAYNELYKNYINIELNSTFNPVFTTLSVGDNKYTYLIVKGSDLEQTENVPSKIVEEYKKVDETKENNSNSENNNNGNNESNKKNPDTGSFTNYYLLSSVIIISILLLITIKKKGHFYKI